MAEQATPVETDENTQVKRGTIGHALKILKCGGRVCRLGWNGRDMWLDLVPADKYTALNIHNGLLPWIGIKTADSHFVPWLASQTDLLAEDWTELIEPK